MYRRGNEKGTYICSLLPKAEFRVHESITNSGAVIPDEKYDTAMAWTAVIILLALFVDRYGWMNIEKEHDFYIMPTFPTHTQKWVFCVIIP